MLAADRDALLCDLAATYGIYDFRALPVPVLATLAVGLREYSRIKMLINGEKARKTDMLLASIVDRLSVILWFLSEDGKNGVNRPKSVLDVMLGAVEDNTGDVQSFENPADFEEAWEKITGVRHG